MSSVAPASQAASFAPRRVAGTPRIAVIGCGAIAERYHLPALGQDPALRQQAVLVDRDPARTEELGERFRISARAADYGDVVEDIDGAIVATPPASHDAICSDLIQRGIPVLCEKPLVDRSEDGHALVRAAESAGVPLCLNHTRRLFPANVAIRELIRSGELGELQRIEYVDGQAFSWPTSTGFHFQPGSPGVLLDRGVHSLDLICWWLGTKPELAQSLNDSYGGPESLVWLELREGLCRINVRLSWLTKLQNYYRIQGDQGTVQGGIEEWSSVRLTRPSGDVEVIKTPCDEIEYKDFGRRMIANFVDVIRGRAEPAVPASDVMDSLELIEEAYEKARRLDLPWTFDTSVTHG